jgi:hypothetical protein
VFGLGEDGAPADGRGHGGKWHLDFNYQNGTDTERSRLMSTAATLHLTPAYALYLGTGDYRNLEPCPDSHCSRCLPCVKRSVSPLPGAVG